MASVSGGYPAKAVERRKQEEGNAKAQSRREEHEKDSVVACRGMGILPMIPMGPPPEAGDATWGMAFFAVKGTARARRGRDALATAPPWRGGVTLNNLTH